MLPLVTLPTPAEPFATAWHEGECDPNPKPGVRAFRDFVLEHQAGSDAGITRSCSVGGPSAHWSGRAWDWRISAEDPQQRARAEELLAWLLANDAEMFRRVGLTYMIWNKKGWRPGRGWRPYDGYDADGQCALRACRHPHTDHVHFSFGKDGAAGNTSFYRWLRGELQPAPPTTPPLLRATDTLPWLPFLGFAVGFAAVSVIAERRLHV